VNFSLALKSDGTVWSWGYNAVGQLGDGTKSNRITPVKVIGISDVVHIAGGNYHSVALKADGTVWAWGDNEFGGLGTGNTTEMITPKQVNLLTDIIGIAAGDHYSMALKSDGSVWPFGWNKYGGLGDGTTYNRVNPIKLNLNLGPFNTEIIMTSDVNIALNDTATQSNHAITGTVKAMAETKNYLNLVIKKLDGEIVSSQVLNINNSSGNDSKGDYIIANLSGVNITSGPIDLSQTALGKYTFTYYLETESGKKSNEVTQNVIINRAINTPTSYIELVQFEATSGLYDMEFNAKGYDAVNGLADAAYKYTLYDEAGVEVPRTGEEWNIASDISTYKQTSLVPNTKYKAKLEIKNGINEVATFYKDVVTLNEESVLSVDNAETNITSTNVTLKIADGNPINTEYRFYVNENYVSSNGRAMGAEPEAWYSLEQIESSTNKIFDVGGLEPGQTYAIACESLNKAGAISARSSVLNITTLNVKPEAPGITSYEEYDDKIKIHWTEGKYAESYIIIVDGIEVDSTTALEYEFTTDPSKINHRVLVKANNNAGSTLSIPLIIKKKVELPQKISLTTAILNNSVELNWDEVAGVYGYELLVDGDVINLGKRTKYVHTGMNALSQHSYKVRAYNSSGYGLWSDLALIMTTNGDVTQAISVESVATDTEVTLKWNSIDNAYKVNVTFDSMEFVDVKENFCKIEGLKANTLYDYKIEISNQYETSTIASIEPSITTKTLPAPGNIIVNEAVENVSLAWDHVPEATGYVVRVNGVIKNAVGNSYIDDEIAPGKRGNYEVAAKDKDGVYGSFSSINTGERLPAQLLKPEKIYALAMNNAIKIMWTGVEKKKGYEVDVNGIIIDNEDRLVYTHRNLNPLTEYKYRVRAISDAIAGAWSDEVIVKTLFKAPETPKNVNITSTKYVATIQWDSTEGSSYRIKITDGVTGLVTGPIELGTKNKYIHRKLNPQTEYSYQLQSYNSLGDSQWTGEIVHNHLLAKCIQDEALDLGLTASKVTDFDQYVLKVSYNHKALKVDDLSAYTTEKEITEGMVDGTDIEIVDVREGQVTFKVHKAIEEGYTWTGVINNIRFIPVIDGGMHISYVVEKIN